MENKYLNNGTNLNMDAFGEGLLRCVANAEDYCANLDKKIHHLTHMAFIPYVSAAEQYDKIINEMCLKGDIISLYKTFVKWFKSLEKKQRQMIKSYFFDEDARSCRENSLTLFRKDRQVLRACRSFVTYLDAIGYATPEELMEHPFVRRMYNEVIRLNKIYKKRGFASKKGGMKHDHTANEGCNCGCVRN